MGRRHSRDCERVRATCPMESLLAMGRLHGNHHRRSVLEEVVGDSACILFSQPVMIALVLLKYC